MNARKTRGPYVVQWYDKNWMTVGRAQFEKLRDAHIKYDQIVEKITNGNGAVKIANATIEGYVTIRSTRDEGAE